MLDLVQNTITRRITTVHNGKGPDFTLVSVEPSMSQRTVELVVGGWWKDRCACSFTKSGLADLILILRDVHMAMRDDS